MTADPEQLPFIEEDIHEYFAGIYERSNEMSKRHVVIGGVGEIGMLGFDRLASILRKEMKIDSRRDPLQVIYAGVSTDEEDMVHSKIDQLTGALMTRNRFGRVIQGDIMAGMPYQNPHGLEDHFLGMVAYRACLLDRFESYESTRELIDSGDMSNIGTVALLDDESMGELKLKAPGAYLFQHLQAPSSTWTQIAGPRYL